MDRIKKVKLETINLTKKQTSKSSYNAKATEIEDVNTVQLTSSIMGEEKVKTIANSIIKAIPTLSQQAAQNIASQLIKYGFSEEAAQNITGKGNRNGDIVLTSQDGNKLIFKKNGPEYIFDSIIKANNDTIPIQDANREKNGFDAKFFLTTNEQNKIKWTINAKETTRINGYVELDIKGNKTKIYWVGDLSYDKFMERAELIKEAMEVYPEAIINTVFNDEFNGFFIGGRYDTNFIEQHDFTKEQAESLAGFVDYRRFVYLCGDAEAKDFYKSTIIHEFAHLLDYALGRNNYDESYITNSGEDKEIKDLYQKYKKILQPIVEGGYNNEKIYPDGIPNEEEFFAESIEIYLTRPDELKKTVPEVYEYIEKMIKDIEKEGEK